MRGGSGRGGAVHPARQADALPVARSRVRLFIFKLAAAFFITGVGGVALKKAGLELPETAGPVAWATLIGGFVIFARGTLGQRPARGRRRSAGFRPSWSGFAQLLAAVFPGTSRSGTTILAPWPREPPASRRPSFPFSWASRRCCRRGLSRSSMPGRMPSAQGVEMTENWAQLTGRRASWRPSRRSSR